MGMETIMFGIIVGAFATFIIGVGYVDIIANAKAITADEERAARVQPVPVVSRAPEFKQAA